MGNMLYEVQLICEEEVFFSHLVALTEDKLNNYFCSIIIEIAADYRL
ncbi:hypothetical protein MAMMFC1_00078 [Methylomusa anaerophila]|uniref:Uncharacterized protein n=1 Tax=Methylomusa anaerophila TaxID=1930071 RepID=A0A348AEE7_9FIRM|nr:hypothetical protein MAMMFC1_00078 [Methylomusa anaerophila]